VLLSYNALPPAGEEPAACPRSAEALQAFTAQLKALASLAKPSAVGIGGRLPARMRTDKRTAGTRFKNGRLTADRVRELAAAASLAAPEARVFAWADLLNPCGGLQLPEDSPAASTEMLDPGLRHKLTLLVRLDRADAAGRGLIHASAHFLLSRGYRTVGWVGSRSGAAEAWAREFAGWRPEKAPATGGNKPGIPAGMVLRAEGVRLLEMERFAEAAWSGTPPPKGK
jgi:hypothetical protein